MFLCYLQQGLSKFSVVRLIMKLKQIQMRYDTDSIMESKAKPNLYLPDLWKHLLPK